MRVLTVLIPVRGCVAEVPPRVVVDVRAGTRVSDAIAAQQPTLEVVTLAHEGKLWTPFEPEPPIGSAASTGSMVPVVACTVRSAGGRKRRRVAATAAAPEPTPEAASLVAMGFDPALVRTALAATSGDPNAAFDVLSSGAVVAVPEAEEREAGVFARDAQLPLGIASLPRWTQLSAAVRRAPHKIAPLLVDMCGAGGAARNGDETLLAVFAANGPAVAVALAGISTVGGAPPWHVSPTQATALDGMVERSVMRESLATSYAGRGNSSRSRGGNEGGHAPSAKRARRAQEQGSIFVDSSEDEAPVGVSAEEVDNVKQLLAGCGFIVTTERVREVFASVGGNADAACEVLMGGDRERELEHTGVEGAAE